MHSMKKILFTIHILVFIAVSAATTDFFKPDTDQDYMRPKKKMYVKQPYRGNERLRTRQASGYRYGSSTIPNNEYSYVYTSESPRTAWKPITYIPEYHLKDVRPTTSHGKVVPIDYGKATKRKEHIILVETENPHTQNVAPGNAPYNNYALLHYYVPFEVAKGKPIEEQILEIPKKPVTIEHFVKATVQPISIFSTSTTTSAPKTIKAPKFEEHTDAKDEDFAGSYEYEYVVQDNHYGTNFGHKEYRDGKSTKGKYEVVLPDGRVQHVRYWSDETGYHATVTYHPLHRKAKK